MKSRLLLPFQVLCSNPPNPKAVKRDQIQPIRIQPNMQELDHKKQEPLKQEGMWCATFNTIYCNTADSCAAEGGE